MLASRVKKVPAMNLKKGMYFKYNEDFFQIQSAMKLKDFVMSITYLKDGNEYHKNFLHAEQIEILTKTK